MPFRYFSLFECFEAVLCSYPGFADVGIVARGNEKSNAKVAKLRDVAAACH